VGKRQRGLSARLWRSLRRQKLRLPRGFT